MNASDDAESLRAWAHKLHENHDMRHLLLEIATRIDRALYPTELANTLAKSYVESFVTGPEEGCGVLQIIYDEHAQAQLAHDAICAIIDQSKPSI